MHIVLVRTLQRAEDVFIAQFITLSLNRKIFVVFCKFRMEHTHTHTQTHTHTHTAWKNTDFLNVTASGTFYCHRALNCSSGSHMVDLPRCVVFL
jgi:hypothetical protein